MYLNRTRLSKSLANSYFCGLEVSGIVSSKLKFGLIAQPSVYSTNNSTRLCSKLLHDISTVLYSMLHYISHEWFSGGHRDLSLHAVRHVSEESLSVRAFVPDPEVVKEVHHPLLHWRGQLLLMHVVLHGFDRNVHSDNLICG